MACLGLPCLPNPSCIFALSTACDSWLSFSFPRPCEHALPPQHTFCVPSEPRVVHSRRRLSHGWCRGSGTGRRHWVALSQLRPCGGQPPAGHGESSLTPPYPFPFRSPNARPALRISPSFPGSPTRPDVRCHLLPPLSFAPSSPLHALPRPPTDNTKGPSLGITDNPLPLIMRNRPTGLIATRHIRLFMATPLRLLLESNGPSHRQGRSSNDSGAMGS